MTNVILVLSVVLLCCYTRAHYDLGIFDVTREIQRVNCCDVCLCRNDTISCHTRDLYFTPENCSLTTSTLDLEGNHITVLPRDSFANLSLLTTLILRGNELKAIHRQAFSDLVSLQLVDLSHNQLANIRLDMPATLIQVDLSFNKLDWVVDPTVLNASNLKFMNLSHNLIKAPRLHLDKSFSRFDELQVLDISGNVFMSMVEDSLSHLPSSVVKLIISNCDMIDTEETALQQPGRHLKYLDLSGNFLTLNELKALFSNMPNNTVETILMKDMKIQEVVPDPFFPNWLNLKYVDFSQNRIEMVSDIAFKGTEIEVLNLGDNLLRGSIMNLTSKNLPKLRSVSLYGNNLDWIPILDLETLTSINLSRNKIQSVDTSYLTSTNLSRFIISDNSISEIELTVFDDFVHLEYLDISHNLVTSIELSSAVARRLHTLKLNNNNITDIIVDKSKRHFHLEHLDLSSNQLSYLPQNFFQRLPKLSYLNLAGNPELLQKPLPLLSSLHLTTADFSENGLTSFKHVLDGSLCVESLVLANNAFTEIHYKDFENLDKACLLSLDLSHNQLPSINFTIFELFPNLETVNLANNPFWCSCGLDKFLEWIRTTRIQLQEYSYNYQCQEPFELRHVQVWNVRQSLIQDCTPLSWFTTKGVYVTIALTVALFLLLLLALVVSRDVFNLCRLKIPDKIYVTCTEKVKNFRRSSKDYPQLFSASSSRSMSSSGYHHLETDTSQC